MAISGGKNGQKNFQILLKNMNLHIQEAQWTPSMINSRKSRLRHIKSIYQKMNTKRIFKARQRWLFMYKGSSIRFRVNFLSPTIIVRRQWDDIIKLLKKKKCQPIILYLEKLSFKNKGETKLFPKILKMRNFIVSRFALNKMLKGGFQANVTRQ